eukprot:TRINITY_DN69957_c0_g1_i1.p1 TRINITY_DN69957_c0_g1~~TRINITY_DN69957_c0_g1_i1.p1  ORF type:complete len:109 (+),score=10.39 TRINITY_DN69957_c0_g1_i1:166-492(+)
MILPGLLKKSSLPCMDPLMLLLCIHKAIGPTKNETKDSSLDIHLHRHSSQHHVQEKSNRHERDNIIGDMVSMMSSLSELNEKGFEPKNQKGDVPQYKALAHCQLLQLL